MKIIFLGTPEFSVPILEALNKQHEIVLVVSQPNKPQGRKQEVKHTPVAAYAIAHNLALQQPVKIKEIEYIIASLEPDFIITAAYGQFIPSSILRMAKKYALNVHASLLPKYRGGAPIQYALLNGEEETGVTIMEMVSKMDAGPIFAQSSIDIEKDDNSETLFKKLSILGKELLLDTLPLIINNTLRPTPQDESNISFAYNIKPEECRINWSLSSKTIINQIRALSPSPGAYTFYDDIMIKIFKAEKREYVGDEDAGMILSLDKKILIKTKDGAIMIEILQQSGKKIMDYKAFLCGLRIFKVGNKFI